MPETRRAVAASSLRPAPDPPARLGEEGGGLQPPPLRLAVIGDTHYLNPAYHRRLLGAEGHPPDEAEKARFYGWNTEHVLPVLIQDVRAATPDLVIHLGDVVHGHRDNVTADHAALLEALDVLRGIGRPLLFVRGTHEGDPGSEADAIYRRHYLAEIACSIGQPRADVTTSYALAAGGCRLIVLDYTTFQPGDAADHMLVEQLHQASQQNEYVFVFGHAPLLPVERPFSSRPAYAQTVLQRLAHASVAVDAYFCGHTHQQLVSAHRLVAGNHPDDQPRWLTQLQGVPLGDPDQEPVPLERLRALLPSPELFRYGWGFVLRSAPGWFLVEVGRTVATARWRRIGAPEPAGQVSWREQGQPEFFPASVPAPAAPPAWPLRPADPRVQSVWLHAAGTGSRAPHRVRLNGCDVGALPPFSSFEARKGLAVPAACWDRLGPENELCIEPVAAEERCLGHFVLELTLADGGVARTLPPPEILTTSARWNVWPEVTPRLRRVGALAPLRFTLRF